MIYFFDKLQKKIAKTANNQKLCKSQYHFYAQVNTLRKEIFHSAFWIFCQ